MKIVYLTPAALMGGAERSLLDLMAAVRQERPDAELSLISGGEGPLLAQAEGLGIRSLLLPLPRALATWGDSALGGRSRLFRLLSLATKGLPAGLAVRSYARKLKETLEPLAPDLVHSNGLKTHVLSHLAGLSCPVVWHLRDYIGRRALMRRLLAWAAKSASLGIGVSKSVAEDARRVLPGLEVEAVYDSIDTDYFRPGAHEGGWLDSLAGFAPLASGAMAPIRIGIVAAYARWKGQEVFLEAAARTLELRASAMVPLRFFVVGGPIYATQGSQWSEAELRDRAEALGLADQVGFIPFQNDVARIYRGLDIMVHASTEPEPYGRTIVEAQACGRAVIVAEAGGAAELITPRVDALGVPPRDAAALSAALMRLVSDEDMRTRFGEAGRQKTVERFALPRLGREMLAIYDRLLHSRRSLKS